MTNSPLRIWPRFVSAVAALLGLAVGVPTALVASSSAAFGTSHPLQGLDSAAVAESLQRELSAAEVVSIILRTVLTAGWLLWGALMLSVVAAVLRARPRLSHVHVPRFAAFNGLATWIATGLTVLSSLTPRIALASTSGSAGAVTITVSSSTEPERTPLLDRPGYVRVETGESIEMFAERTVGDGSRWPEIWELGRGTVVDEPSGRVWDEPWTLRGGWQLRVPNPRHQTPVLGSAPTARRVTVETSEATHVVVAGDSYWSIAARHLESSLGRPANVDEVARLTEDLVASNAPRLGHDDPTMLHPGDIVHVDLEPTSPEPAAADRWVVQSGDSYWTIASDTLALRTGAEPADAEVMRLVHELVERNAPRLGYDDTSLLRPGDVVEFAPPEHPPVDDSPTPTVPTPTAGQVPTTATVAGAGTPVASDPPTGSSQPSNVGDSRAAAGDVASTAPPEEVPLSATDRPRAELPTVTTPEVDRAASPRISLPGLEGEVPARSTQSGRLASVDNVGEELPASPEGETSSTDVPIRPLAGITALTAAGLAIAVRYRSRRAHQLIRRGRRAPDLQPSEAAAHADLVFRGVSDLVWMDHELRLLAHLLDPHDRRQLTIQLVMLGPGRQLEVAFTEIPRMRPPDSWTPAADRVWRLDAAHGDEALAEVGAAPPVAPGLVTLGDSSEGGQIYLNIEAFAGITVTGNSSQVNAWLANVTWELHGQAIAEGTDLKIVAGDDFDAFRIPADVERVDPANLPTVIDQLSATGGATGRTSMLELRSATWEAWPIAIVIVADAIDTAATAGLRTIATMQSVAVITTGDELGDGLRLTIADGIITVPSLGLELPATSLTAEEQLVIENLLDAAGADPVEVSDIASTDAQPLHSEDDAAEWVAPEWPVMVNVLGTPHATKRGKPLSLTRQQLSALALIAIRREIPGHDFKRAIWGDEDDVSPARVRDMLSTLRKKVGGLSVIPKREDGMVCAGPELGSDTLLFEALAARSTTVPAEKLDRLHEMIDLVCGRLFDYPSADQTWWRWAELAYGMTDWTARVTSAVEELGRTYLDRHEPAAARDVAERGLTADPLNAALTELLMESYAQLGSLDAAQRVYESHDRVLDLEDLGGATDETRRVLERLRAAHHKSVSDAIAIEAESRQAS